MFLNIKEIIRKVFYWILGLTVALIGIYMGVLTFQKMSSAESLSIHNNIPKHINPKIPGVILGIPDTIKKAIDKKDAVPIVYKSYLPAQIKMYENQRYYSGNKIDTAITNAYLREIKSDTSIALLNPLAYIKEVKDDASVKLLNVSTVTIAKKENNDEEIFIQLEKWHELLLKGMINQNDYEIQKNRLLNKL